MQITDVPVPTRSSSSAPLDITSDEVWRALRGRQLMPFFQPKVSMRKREVAGAEALMRWIRPGHGLICARSLLPYLSDRVLAEEVSLRIIELSLAECRRWLDIGLDMQIAINLPVELLRDSEVARFIASQASGHGVDPSKIIVEVPEVAFANSPADELDRLVEVRVRGFGLSVDDFGTGQCTREQLERIPASEMKVDRAVLVLAMLDREARARLSSSLSIARDLNLDIVMEGVETLEEWEFAAELDCDYAQGFFVAEPMSGEAFLNWTLRADGRSSAWAHANG